MHLDGGKENPAFFCIRDCLFEAACLYTQGFTSMTVGILQERVEALQEPLFQDVRANKKG
jgi:hypothetical protein